MLCKVPFHLMNNSKTLPGFSCAGNWLKSQLLRVLSCFLLEEKGQSEGMKAWNYLQHSIITLPSLKRNENLHKYIVQCMPNEYISQHRGTGCNDLVHLLASHNTSWSVEKPAVMYVHILISKPQRILNQNMNSMCTYIVPH